MTQYDVVYNTGNIDAEQLSREIAASSIIVAFDHLSQFGVTVSCYFRADLSEEDQATLESVVTAHVPQPVVTPPAEVTTQFEKNDKDLKLASAIQDVDALTGTATVLLQVPGEPGSGDGRWVAGGEAWFESESIGDRVMVYIVDHDNILGQGADLVVKSYTDDDVAEANQGWRIPVKAGRVTVEPIGGYGFLPAGFYIKVIGQRDPNLVQGGKFVFNIFWGKKE